MPGYRAKNTTAMFAGAGMSEGNAAAGGANEERNPIPLVS